jgi:hypothetical protein
MFLVSENTTSYGKDLGDLQLMEKILPEIAALPGVGTCTSVISAAS